MRSIWTQCLMMLLQNQQKNHHPQFPLGESKLTHCQTNQTRHVNYYNNYRCIVYCMLKSDGTEQQTIEHNRPLHHVCECHAAS